MGDKNVPVPDPQPSPMPISIDPVALVQGMLNCYQNITISKEEQLTLRTQVREQSRVCIAAIEANTKEFEMALNQIKTERTELVRNLCEIIRMDGVDENSLKICQLILEYLTDSNPMNYAGKSLKFGNTVSEMIGGGA